MYTPRLSVCWSMITELIFVDRYRLLVWGREITTTNGWITFVTLCRFDCNDPDVVILYFFSDFEFEDHLTIILVLWISIFLSNHIIYT